MSEDLNDAFWALTEAPLDPVTELEAGNALDSANAIGPDATGQSDCDQATVTLFLM